MQKKREEEHRRKRDHKTGAKREREKCSRFQAHSFTHDCLCSHGTRPTATAALSTRLTTTKKSERSTQMRWLVQLVDIVFNWHYPKVCLLSRPQLKAMACIHKWGQHRSSNTESKTKSVRNVYVCMHGIYLNVLLIRTRNKVAFRQSVLSYLQAFSVFWMKWENHHCLMVELGEWYEQTVKWLWYLRVRRTCHRDSEMQGMKQKTNAPICCRTSSNTWFCR